MSNSKTVLVNILEKEYQVACPPEQQFALDRAAKELNKRMRAIRATGSVIGAERIAVMAALNLCYELQDPSGAQFDENANAALGNISDKLDKALKD